MTYTKRESECRLNKARAFGRLLRLGLGLLCIAILTAVAWLPLAAQDEGDDSIGIPMLVRLITAERTGSIPTHDSLRLRLIADSGNVNIFADATDEVRYRVVVEAEGGDAAVNFLRQFMLSAAATPRGVMLAGAMPDRNGLAHVRVSYEVHVPRHYDLEISTLAGDIVAQDIDGRVALSTGGGDIHIGRVGGDSGHTYPGVGPHGRGEFAARLQTGGGHIVTGDVGGALEAVTTGGHITAGNVSGDAVLRTDGGHIQVGRISGTAQLYSGGGDIAAAGAGAGVVAETAGGRIEFGSADGAIRARTGGGGIRIAHLAGPTDLASSNGEISVAGIEAPLHVSTTAGPIIASFSSLYREGPGTSELTSGQGDIVVYLPRDLAVTIDARVSLSRDPGDKSNHRILADAAFPLRVSYGDSAGGHALRGECAMNGGGEVIHLKTTAGNIELRFLDANTRPRQAERQAPTTERQLQGQNAGLGATEQQVAVRAPTASMTADDERFQAAMESQQTGLAMLMRMFDELWWGGVRVDPEEQQKRLTHPVPPLYPEVAREAGIEGDVALRVLVGKDGTVTGMNVLYGDPVLVRAAVRAVEEWRYDPVLLSGRPVNVVTTVTLAFRLR